MYDLQNHRKTTNKVEPVAIPSTPAKSDSSPQSSAEDADILLYSPRRRDPTETPPKTPAQEPEAITAGAEPVGRPRSRSITKAPYMNTLAPIAELPEVNGTSKATVVGTDDKVSTLSSSLSLQSPVGMESNNNSSKQVTPRKDNNMISVGFADHSVASDVIGTSYRKTHHIMMLDASSPVPAAVDKPILGGGILHKVGSLPTNASKTVSFSLMNQTIDADNTIRRSSVTMAIVPPTPPTPEADSDDEENLESEKVVPRNLGRSPMPSVLAQPVVAIETVNPEVDTSGNNLNSDNVTATNTMINRLSVGGNTGNASHVSSSSSTRPGANASLHLEMASLANSISQVNTSRILAASGRHSTSLRNSYVGSVMSHTMRFDGEDIQQQELTEKAVVVIRRVLDKLTGLDFAEVNTTTGVSSQTALEVEEQVDRLIREATSNENLSQSFFGWCPFW